MTDPRFPDRPDSADFWLMAEVIQDLDSAADDGLPADRIVADLDLSAVAYIAKQRALRAQNMLKGHQVAPTWFDAFVVGVMFQRRKGLPAEIVEAVQSMHSSSMGSRETLKRMYAEAEESGDYSDADETSADHREHIHDDVDAMLDVFARVYPNLFAE